MFRPVPLGSDLLSGESRATEKVDRQVGGTPHAQVRQRGTQGTGKLEAVPGQPDGHGDVVKPRMQINDEVFVR